MIKKTHKQLKTKLWTTRIADKVFSKYVRERDKVCFFGCGRLASQNSHFWGRARSSTRFDPENCDGICGKCHFTHEGNKQGLYRELKIKQLGEIGYKKLENRAQSIVKRRDAIKECMNFLKDINGIV